MLPTWNTIDIYAKFPKPPDYPYTVTNVGEAIKKKRMDLRLSKVQLAEILNVKTMTIWTWEEKKVKPTPRMMKRIINWLCYVPPLNVDINTLGGQLYIHRMILGKTQYEVARELMIDVNVVIQIERNEIVEERYIIGIQDYVLCRLN